MSETISIRACQCGCGKTFWSTDSRGRERRFFSPGCSLRANNYMRLQGHTAPVVRKPVQLSLLNPFFGRRHSEKTRAVLSKKAARPKPNLRGERNGMYGRSGPLNPRYIDGSSPERQLAYASAEWREVSRIVRARDGFRCRNCGTEKRGRKSLHLHHVRPWASHPNLRFDPDNIVTLCADCHRAEHRKEVRHQ